ncbi:hypothetical protein TWF694_006811 [Orbilia ellipsospora]|uniref:Uncharacterized protein n=1 Tax=Orbilia ellipsospora TaxID=2528407 RepID=A0AAV9XPQ3_9PEZI
MRRFVGRLVRSSWPCFLRPTTIQLSWCASHHLTTIGRHNGIKTRDVITSTIVSYRRLRRIQDGQLKYQVRYHQDDRDDGRSSKIPEWFHPENWLPKETEDVIYGDDRDLENLPPEPPKQEWWMAAQYPTGKVGKTEDAQETIEPSSEHEEVPEETRARSILADRLNAHAKILTPIFGRESEGFRDFRREAHVESQEMLGKLLVDLPGVRDYREYWLELLRFRARIHGDIGIKDVWIGFSLRNIEPPHVGPTADEMWRYFVKAGLEDEAFLNRLYRHNLQTIEKKGNRRWRLFYTEVVTGFLAKDSAKALMWHRRLLDLNPPKNIWEDFFKSNATDPKHLPTLFKIFASKKIGPSYNFIIPYFCRQEEYETAIWWHEMLFRKGDFPADSHLADRILEYYAFHKPLKDVEGMIRDFHKKNIKLVESTVISLIKARYRTRPIMELFCKLHSEGIVPNDIFGDKFWAFLLTYQRFTEQDVAKYMRRMKIHFIGTSTTKEFVKRGSTIASFIRGIALLHKRKMGVDKEVYDKYFEVKARYKPAEALEESLPIEGMEISRANALLQAYLSTYRWKFFNHVYLNLRRKNVLTCNLFLRRLFMTGSVKQGLELMEEMRVSSTPISSSAQRELLRALLAPRRPGHRPITQSPGADGNKDLYLAENYLRLLLMNGERVDPRIWMEVMKRFGMFRKLKHLKRLCLWLVDWYDPRQGALRQSSTPIKFTDVGRIASLDYENPERVAWTAPPLSHSNRSPQNPLRILFPPTTIRALVEWGFMSMKKRFYVKLIQRNTSLKVKATSRCMWGIRLVKKLQKKGVWVDKRSVARAVRIRLRRLDGSRFRWESFDTNMNKQLHVDLGVIAAIAQKAWGAHEELFPKGSWNTDGGLTKMLRAPMRNFIPRHPRIRTGRRISSQLRMDYRLVPMVSKI